MKRIILLIALVPSLLFAQNSREQLTNELSGMAGDTGMVGFAVAIIVQDQIIYENGFGFADRENKTPYTVHTVQPIASISKTLIGVSLMKAQELNLLNLDDDINEYLPFCIINPYHPKSKITIRQLSHHSSSLLDTKHYEKSYIFETEIPKIYKEFPVGIKRFAARRIVKGYNKNVDMPLTEFLWNLYHPDGNWYNKKNFRKEAPGERISYSNNGAAIASIIIEKASGISYTDFVKKYILDPLNMDHSGWDMHDFSEHDRSKLYPFHLEIPYYKLITLADGGFITSIHDFAKYLSAIMRGYEGESNIISDRSYEIMLKQDTSRGNGVFWSVDEFGDGNYIGHSGGDPGIHTRAVFDKRSNLGFICFSNTNTFEADEVEEVLKIMIKYAPQIYEEHSEL